MLRSIDAVHRFSEYFHPTELDDFEIDRNHHGPNGEQYQQENEEPDHDNYSMSKQVNQSVLHSVPSMLNSQPSRPLPIKTHRSVLNSIDKQNFCRTETIQFKPGKFINLPKMQKVL